MIIAICNQKGGVGKTTIATNLAHQLSTGEATLVVDLDPQGNATSTLGVELSPQELTINDVLAGVAQGMDATRAAMEAIRMVGAPWNVDVIPADRLLASRESDTDLGRESRLKTVTDLLHHNRYGHIVIDCPPSLGMLTTNALVAADTAVIITTARETSADGVAEMISTISTVRSYYNPRLRLSSIVINAYRNERSDPKMWKAALSDVYGTYLLDSELPEREYIARATSAHAPIPFGIDHRTDTTLAALAMRIAQ